jgi:hypothetical protein
MSITATVENDTIKLPPGVHLPGGTTVIVEPQEKPRAVETPRKPLAERYAKYIGCVDSGLGDLADNHDHYLYGTPKRKP